MTDHLTRERLLRYMDGELSLSAIASAAEHLQSCWSCRVELGRLEEDIATIIDAHNKVFLPALPDPPKPWSPIEPKLNACKQSSWSSFFWALIAPIAEASRRPLLRYATAALVVLLIISLMLSPLSPVSAKEVLRQVEMADARRLLITPHQAIRQRVRIRMFDRHAFGTKTSTLESWKTGNASYWNPGNDAVNSELLDRYKTNGISASLPLSFMAIESWKNLAGSAPVASREGDGALNIVLVSSASARARGLEGVSFRVQPRDWSVSELKLSFSDAIFDITEESLAVVDKAQVPREMLATLEPPEPSVRIPILASAPHSIQHRVVVPNLDDLEVRVRYGLHSIGADMGESIEVTRGAGQVVVDAWPVPPSRKAELAQVLGDKPGVRLDFLPPDDPTASKVMVILPGRSSLQPPEDQRLARFFGSPEVEENYTRSVLETRKVLLAHLYALQTLANRWPPEAEAQLSTPAREQLSGMVQDHSAGARAALLDLHSALDPLLEHFGYTAAPAIPANETMRWQNSAVAALESARSTERTLLSLLTTSDTPAYVDDALPKLQLELQELGHIIDSLPASDMP